MSWAFGVLVAFWAGGVARDFAFASWAADAVLQAHFLVADYASGIGQPNLTRGTLVLWPSLLNLRRKIREALRDEMPGDRDNIERTISRILELVNPFEKAAQEELERYRSTFAELAK